MDGGRFCNAAAGLLGPDPGAAGRGDRLAFIDPVRTLTYGELAQSVARFANLMADFGVRHGASLALLLDDTIDAPTAILGAMTARVVPVPIDPARTGEEIAAILSDCGARVIVVATAHLALFEPVLRQQSELTHVIATGGEAPAYGFSLVRELAAQSAQASPATTEAGETALCLYALGPNGSVKATALTHGAVMETARGYGQGRVGLKPDDVVFSAAKIASADGFASALSGPVSVGATTVLMSEPPTPEALFRTLKRHQPTVFCAEPADFAAMLAAEESARADSSGRLRICASAGEPLPAGIGTAWKERYGVEIIDGTAPA